MDISIERHPSRARSREYSDSNVPLVYFLTGNVAHNLAITSWKCWADFPLLAFPDFLPNHSPLVYPAQIPNQQHRTSHVEYLEPVYNPDDQFITLSSHFPFHPAPFIVTFPLQIHQT